MKPSSAKEKQKKPIIARGRVDVSKKGKGKKAAKDDAGGDKEVWNSEKLKKR